MPHCTQDVNSHAFSLRNTRRRMPNTTSQLPVLSRAATRGRGTGQALQLIHASTNFIVLMQRLEHMLRQPSIVRPHSWHEPAT